MWMNDWIAKTHSLHFYLAIRADFSTFAITAIHQNLQIFD